VKTNLDSPYIRRKPNYRSATEELKFVRSFKDLDIFWQKAMFVLPRLTGTVDRWTDIPPSIQVEPTNSCNIRCLTCCRSVSKRPVGFMDIELFKKIMDDASQIGVKRVQLFLMGEPLVHPRIIEMIRYLKSKGLAFHLTTNGLAFSKAIGDGILGAGATSADYVTFSILGYSKELHEKMMQGVKHDKVMENIHNFINARNASKHNGPIIETVFYSVSQTEHEIEPFMNYWSKVADHAIYGGKAVEAFIDHSLPSNPRTKTCSVLWERMAIQWNGDVVLCGEDSEGEFVVGNLHDSSISEVWNGEKLVNLKKLHKAGQFSQISLCEFCDW
jgi:radical SAM protein with 4Fe4S-binding SPASM domain